MKTSDYVRAEFIQVTPVMAGEWLEKNIAKNRKVRERVESKYLVRMKKGDWNECNGETIKFDRDGNLIDGQHRLRALVTFGKPFFFLVAYNCSATAFKTIDDGSNRRGPDVLSIEGDANCNILAAALTLVWKYNTRNMGNSTTPSNEEICALSEHHSKMAESVAVAVRNRTAKGYLAPSIVAFMHYMGTRTQGAEKADKFVASLCQQEPTLNDQPVRVLRDRLIDNLASKARLSRIDLLALVLKTWNAFVKGERLNKTGLRWRTNGDCPEQFPKFV